MNFDVLVIGAGAAGMHCAAIAGQRGLRVALIDHAEKLGEKIRISGGGRCNFTNIHTRVECFVGENPWFARSALSRYTPSDFLDLLRRHGVGWEEKHKGQLFCRERSQAIIEVLRAECGAGRVQWFMPCAVKGVQPQADGRWAVQTERGELTAPQVVIATGGLPIPAIGATDFGLRLAKSLGLRVVEPRPALVPLTFDAQAWAPFVELAGVALEVGVESVAGRPGRGAGATALRAAEAAPGQNRAAPGQNQAAPGQNQAAKGQPSKKRSGLGASLPMHFDEDLLFTHRGLSGPAILQISSYWNPGEPLTLDLWAGESATEALLAAKHGGRQQVETFLATKLPKRLAETWTALAGLSDTRLADVPDRTLRDLGQQLSAWTVHPTGTEGWRKAEVMRGGVATDELDQNTMQSKRHPGLFFIGEVVDITGWLGGYNFQWAWASAHACASALEAQLA